MDSSSCSLLEQFIADELDSATRHRFETHLANCPTCCASLELQRSINSALVTYNAQVEVPAYLINSVERRIQTAQRRTAWVLAGAAAVLVAAGTIAFTSMLAGTDAEQLPGHSSPIAENNAQRSEVLEKGETNLSRHVEVTFPSNQDIIAAEFQTEDPTVTIVMVYPGI